MKEKTSPLVLLSNVNLEPLGAYYPVGYFGVYDQIVHELTSEQGHCFQPLYKRIWIHIDAQEFMRQNHDSIQGQQKVIGSLKILLDLVEKFSHLFPQKTLLISSLFVSSWSIHSFIDKGEEPSSKRLCGQLNALIEQLCLRCANVQVFPAHMVFEQLGYVQSFQFKYWYLGRIKYSLKVFEHLAFLMESYERARCGKTKKVLVVDLDNTLWGGVLGELGPEDIVVGHEGVARAYRDFQYLIKRLKDLGFILAIASKNNLEDVREVFKLRNDLALSIEDFSCLKINWEDKADNLFKIAQELNVSLDSFVFIDDNPVERQWVKKALPDVIVPDFPKEPCLLPSWFIHEVVFRYFPKLGITQEDRSKTRLYQQQGQRTSFQKTLSSAEFLKQLDISLKLYINEKSLSSRVSQLTQKTNQFNLSLKRYTQQDIHHFMQSDKWDVFAIDYQDCFGPEGVIGSILLHHEKHYTFLDNFLLSCRVIGRHVEDAFFMRVLNDLALKKVKRLRMQLERGKRNQMIFNLPQKWGLKEVSQNVYEGSLETLVQKKIPNYIHFQY